MTIATLDRPKRRNSLLSDQMYCDDRTESRALRRYSAAPVSMDAPLPFCVHFGNEGFFRMDEEPPKWFIPILAEVCTLGELPPNWNSYGAKPIDPYTAAAAATLLLDVLSEYDPIPAIVPTARGGVMFEWHECGMDLEIDVRSPTFVHVAMEDGGVFEETENASIQLVEDKLRILRSRR